MAKLTPEQKKILRRARKERMACRPAGKLAGCAASTALDYFHWLDRDELIDNSGDEQPREKFKVVESGDARTIEGSSPKRIKTLEDAIAFAEVDTATWRVKSWECTSWEVVMKMKGGDDGDKAERHGLWRVSLKLERVAPKFVIDGLGLVLKQFQAKPFRLEAPRVKPANPGRSMYEINIPDPHFGKLCWGQETGSNCDLRTIEQDFNAVFDDLLDRGAGFKLDKIVYMLGSDFFHYDTPRGTTTSGTPLDVDGRFAKMFSAGVRSSIRAVTLMLEVCRKVHVVLVQGNHDEIASYCLASLIAERFHNDPRVTVDCGPNVRKYVRFGCNLIGHTHGDGIKLDKLPLIMATERKQDWAETTCHEWHLGHFHTSRSFETKTIDEHTGVEVVVVPSTGGTDAWHHKHGFVGNTRGARGFLYDRDYGKTATFNSIVRPQTASRG